MTSNIPRYLFRTYSPGSTGLNSTYGFASMAMAGDATLDSITAMTSAERRDILKDHVLYQSWAREQADDFFISFTPSLLFAIQHAIRKITVCGRTTAENCYIAIIDTAEYPVDTFRWTPTLLSELNLDEDTDSRLRHSYHNAEYLAEWDLGIFGGNAAEHTTLAALINAGLFEAIPRLPSESRQLVIPVSNARYTWYRDFIDLTADDIDHAHTLARCFGVKWYFPIWSWVLALKGKVDIDQEFEEAARTAIYRSVWTVANHSLLRTALIGKLDPIKGYIWVEDDSDNPSSNLREVTEWVRLMRKIYLLKETELQSEGEALEAITAGLLAL